jgi:hypothetical protein
MWDRDIEQSRKKKAVDVSERNPFARWLRWRYQHAVISSSINFSIAQSAMPMNVHHPTMVF